MARILSAKKVTLWASVVVFALIAVLPLGFMVAESLADSKNYTETLGSARIWSLFGRTLLLAFLTTMMAGLLGVGLGLGFAKTDLPMRSALTALFSLPLLFPPYFLAVGWFAVLGRGGLLTLCCGTAAGEMGSRLLFGWPGVILVLSTAFMPVVLLLTMAGLRAVSPNLEQAALLSTGWPVVLRSVTIPLASSSILLSFVLVFLLTMGEFGVPAFLRFDVFAVASFTQFTAFYNYGAATAAAMPLVLIATLGLWVERRVLCGKTFWFGWGSPQINEISLTRMRGPVTAIVSVAALILVVVPLGAVLWRGLDPSTLKLALAWAGDSALRSVVYSAVSATVVSVVAFFLAYLIHRRAVAAWRWVDALSMFLFTLPGTVTGVGLIGLWNRPMTNWIYATPAILVAGYFAQYGAVATRAMAAGLSQVSIALEEAAELAGAGWGSRVTNILLPLLRPSIVAGWTVTFLFCMRDLSLSILLAPAGYDTLTARTMTLMANGSEELIASLCLLLMSLAAIPLGVAAVSSRFWSKAK